MSDTTDWAAIAQKLHQDCRTLESKLAEVTRHRDECFELYAQTLKRSMDSEKTLVDVIKQRDELVNALIDCREDSVELLGERHWWKDEPRLELQTRYEETAENVRKADAALAAVKGGEG